MTWLCQPSSVTKLISLSTAKNFFFVPIGTSPHRQHDPALAGSDVHERRHREGEESRRAAGPNSGPAGFETGAHRQRQHGGAGQPARHGDRASVSSPCSSELPNPDGLSARMPVEGLIKGFFGAPSVPSSALMIAEGINYFREAKRRLLRPRITLSQLLCARFESFLAV